MNSVFIYNFQLDQDLLPYTYFDIGDSKASFDILSNKPEGLGWNAFKELLILAKKYEKLKFSLILSGDFIERIKDEPKVLEKVKQLLLEKRIELIACPYFSSLSVLFSRSLFAYEVNKYLERIDEIFSHKPSGFANTALLYVNDLGSTLKELGFSYALVPKIDWYMPTVTDQIAFKSSIPNFWIVPVGAEIESSDGVKFVDASDIKLSKLKQVSKVADKTIGLYKSITKIKGAEVYSLPQVVVGSEQNFGLEHIIGNNLQKDLFRRLKELSPMVESISDPIRKNKLLRLGALSNFQLLADSINAKERYASYTVLQNFMYSMELELR